VHRRNPAQFRIDLRNKRAKLQLFRKLPRVEIANRTCLNFCRIDLRIVDRLFTGFNNDVPDRFPLFLEVALKVRAPAAENVNFVHSFNNLTNLHALSSRAAHRVPGGHAPRVLAIAPRDRELSLEISARARALPRSSIHPPKALMPVMSRPTINAWMSCVPS
jgi:hypothetical protein